MNCSTELPAGLLAFAKGSTVSNPELAEVPVTGSQIFERNINFSCSKADVRLVRLSRRCSLSRQAALRKAINGFGTTQEQRNLRFFHCLSEKVQKVISSQSCA